MAGSGKAQFQEENLVHVPVVMLTGMDQDLSVALRQGSRQWCCFDELGPGSNHGEDGGHALLQSILPGRISHIARRISSRFTRLGVYSIHPMSFTQRSWERLQCWC